MARPAKSAATTRKNLTKAERKAKQEMEDRLKGSADNLSPPAYLNEKQKVIFQYVIDEMKASGTLGNLDVFALETFAICVDRMRTIDEMINNNSDELSNKGLQATRSGYSKDFFRTMNELGLSPQSRAKLGNINLNDQKKQDDPLLKAMKGERK
ncbi:P27 family phage terminase small subunit [Fictibacillus enclensis]|uniref:P27 family phage terminase small subunit n=1 Tax=Fictibacillus enclensis TaxID=1017270 RepID=UPI0025A30C1D|nr:P27 family phage terminase small subunit [Fictibacillus enclensis]MDM5199245.1 P27 family phage terminase small subunit [Fictibacillus enclensis]